MADFARQSGYWLFSIGYQQVDAVRGYIAGQEADHHRVSFEDEFRESLKRYAVEVAFD